MKTLITVLMPVYNGEEYLAAAVQSILDQSMKAFELLIINDGSTDSSEFIIKSFDDKRIRYEKNEQNMGLINTLNKGINLCQSKYIARMDADDISLPRRLEEQFKYMENHPEIALSGTAIEIFGSQGKIRTLSVSTEDIKIRTEMIFESPFFHPTVIFRRDIFKDESLRYDLSHETVEDYGLWQKIGEKYKLGNINTILLKYRINDQGITRQAVKDEVKRDGVYMGIYQNTFRSLGLEVEEQDLILFRKYLNGKLFENKVVTDDIKRLLHDMKNALVERKYDISIFSKRLAIFYRYNCVVQGYGIRKSLNEYNKGFDDILDFGLMDMMKFTFRRYIRGYKQ